jgi:hypothetical protein
MSRKEFVAWVEGLTSLPVQPQSWAERFGKLSVAGFAV